MSRDVPESVKVARSKGLLDDERFYRLVSEKSNYISEASIRSIYMAIVAVVGSELKANEVARLPHIGDIALVDQAPRMGLMGKVRTWIPATKVLKFIPNELLRRHINDWLRVKAVEADPSIDHKDTPQI